MRKKFSLITFLCLLLIMLLTPMSTYGVDKDIASVYEEYSLDLWHYSGRYWKVGNYGSDKIKIDDDDIEKNGAKTILEANSTATFTVSLPSAVKSAVSEGKDVKIRLESNGVDVKDIFVDGSKSEPVYSGSTMTFTIKPKFNFTDKSVNDYVTLSTQTRIPLIDKEYGYNIFSLYKGSTSLGQADCKFSSASPNTVYSGYLHPSMIKDASGALKPGYTFRKSDGEYKTDAVKII